LVFDKIRAFALEIAPAAAAAERVLRSLALSNPLFADPETTP